MIQRTPRAVVTGAASGLGRAFAVELGKRGGSLLLSDVAAGGLDETRERALEAGARAVHTMTCDVSDAAQVRGMRERAEADLGGCDLLVNNAGVAAAGLLGEMPLEDWAWVMGVNLWGPIYGCHEFVPLMKRQGSGHVLNVASIAAFTQAPRMGPYNVTKAGVVALSETLASEIGPLGIGVTVLCPYFFQTNIMNASRKTNMEARTDERVAREMQKTKAQAQDVARIALAACDDGKLYAFPHPEAKALFAVKRLVPGLLHQRIGPALAKRITGQG